jgi:hypothetical protein
MNQLPRRLRPNLATNLGGSRWATPHRRAGSSRPELRLCGRWLHEAGFVIGRHVNIESNEGRMTIEQVD